MIKNKRLIYIVIEKRIPSLKVIIFILGTCSLVMKTEASTYQIQKGDTLSGIISQRNLKPIYGKSGHLRKVIMLNRNKIRGNGAIIRIGDIIQLPDEMTDTKLVELNVEEETPSTLQIESRSVYPYSYLELTPSFSALKINSINKSKFGGTNATLLSNKGIVLSASWNIAYDENITYFGFATMEYYSFINDINYNFNHSLSRFHFGVGAKTQLNSNIELLTTARIREVSFLDVVTPVNIYTKSIILSEIEVGIKKTFLTKKDFSAKIGGHILGLLPGSVESYHSKMSYGTGVLVELQHVNKSMSLIYDHRSLKIGEIHNNESTISLNLSFSFGIL